MEPKVKKTVVVISPVAHLRLKRLALRRGRRLTELADEAVLRYVKTNNAS
jgi:hypothetical protein